jgi:GntR family transcriptional repressor for pyruvate dehydrogenase complex
MAILIADIVSGARPSGEMLPREVDIAQAFDVSRGVARETIRAMEERGLVSVKHGKGATVNGAKDWHVLDTDVLAATLKTERGSEVLGEYLECRRILEVEAAGMAAERATDEDVEQLEAALHDMEQAAAHPESQAAEERFHQADVAFHQTLIAATGNRVLGGLVAPIHSALLLARFPLARPQHRRDRGLPEHRRLCAAVAARDPDEASRAMSDHLDTIARYLDEHRAGGAPRPRRVATRNGAATPGE